jgi:lysozyme
MTMHLSENGLTLIKNFEGLRLDAYRDAAGVWTIGYGSTRYPDGSKIKQGDQLADALHAGVLLSKTLGSFETAVNRQVKAPLTQNQFDALVSFAYNEGTGALAGSTLLTRLNNNDYNGAALQFLQWNKITDPKTGKKIICDTLVKRRRQESRLFLKL